MVLVFAGLAGYYAARDIIESTFGRTVLPFGSLPFASGSHAPRTGSEPPAAARPVRGCQCLRERGLRCRAGRTACVFEQGKRATDGRGPFGQLALPFCRLPG